jgi:HD superfamily phosphodiesterase
MNLEGRIESAEKKYRQILEEFFLKKWGDTRLFSHDIDHHRRVWHYARELLSETGRNKKIRITFSPDKLLIACYLHDLGMTIDQGDRHGVYSSYLCREFVYQNGLSESEFSGVLTAIKDHDRKEIISTDNYPDLLSFLTIADDLDAYGYIGISRYLEIYIKRGILAADIGYMIRTNASRRFDNFKTTFRNSNALLKKHSGRFKILDDFFNNYNKQVEGSGLDNNNPSGYACVVELVFEMIKEQVVSIDALIITKRFSDDPLVKKFKAQLNSELSSAAKNDTDNFC